MSSSVFSLYINVVAMLMCKVWIKETPEICISQHGVETVII